MTYAKNWLSVISESGYQTVGRFTLPEASWWDEYYRPMTEQLARMRERHRTDQAALSVFDEHDREIEAYRKYSAYYGYVFFVMRLV